MTQKPTVKEKEGSLLQFIQLGSRNWQRRQLKEEQFGLEGKKLRNNGSGQTILPGVSQIGTVGVMKRVLI